MNEFQVACYTGPWGNHGLIEAITDISSCGYEGIECSSSIVNEFEDRLHVFEEILETTHLHLGGLLQGINLLDREKADENVERAANSARFLKAAGEGTLTIYSSLLREEELTEEEWTTAAAIVEEIGQRCYEFGITLCFLPRMMRLIYTANHIKRLLAMTNPQLVYLALDTAEAQLAGQKTEKLIKAHLDRLRLIRYRDVSGSKRRAKVTTDRAGTTPQFGRGAVGFEKVSEAIVSLGYQGWITLDVSGESHTPVDAISFAYRYLQRKSGLYQV